MQQYASEPSVLTATVMRAELVEFAGSVGETRPEYVDAEAAQRAGHPDVLATPTFRRVRVTGDHGPVATLVTTLVMKEVYT